MINVFTSLPGDLTHEIFEELLRHDTIRIERIVSHGHASPEHGWYDQEEHEWVIVLEGSGTILFESGKEVTLSRGDYVNIPSHTRHRVTRTEPDSITIWLAIFYS